MMKSTRLAAGPVFPAAASLLFLALSSMPAATLLAAPPNEVEVDASEAPRRIFHSRVVLSVTPGDLTLAYPKWLPGEHGPTGPIVDLVGLKLTASGQTIRWRRDEVEMFLFHCTIPAGVDRLEARFDVLTPIAAEGFSSGASASPQLATLNWNQLVLYPSKTPARDLVYRAALRLPSGWKFGTSLATAKDEGARVEFLPESLETLVDSPVLMGAHLRDISIGSDARPHKIVVAADSEAALAMVPAQKEAYDRLVAESGALFGARHYQHYAFLLALSDSIAHFGLEHHQSSDDRLGERSLIDEDLRKIHATLLPHEFVHSWNGKYRRPADLATADFEQPMHTELLWVYEGLTQYLGNLLAVRSGLSTPGQYRENLARVALWAGTQKGREWRSLEDTSIAAQILYGAPEHWEASRRGVDFYDEGLLLWLDADTLIRETTGGKRSLDDFCRAFYGGESGSPKVVTYTLDEVVTTLNGVAPYDWRKFFEERVFRTAPKPPLDGVVRGGWKLGESDTRGELQKAREDDADVFDFTGSLGLIVKNKGEIVDVIPGGPAERAGMTPGMTLLAVNSKKFNHHWLRDALGESKGAAAPLELLARSGEFFRVYPVDYHGGERYPILARDETKPDLLAKILAPRTGVAKGAAAKPKP